ncbi:single-stranded DNA-binding protein [Bacillus phage vB_BanS_Nate]|uniref:Single-stranded DNA-binding protein n=1 Tax=Bacillus phage vB_BanS_Nate TaxID=2894788 RepID=A0AAE9CEC6_9CAUD|nr:single-stranded DNA-binding protein [Bacillus phage vB_BanS_Nate]UGO50956.1 single-stranded DNA-binding protein [Bacillus phage vB_BanS_Nate]
MAKKREAVELKQTKSYFKFVGKVTNADKDGFFVEKPAERGAREGDMRRTMRFGIRTSETNTLSVQMFAYEPDEVFLWNSEKKKKNNAYKGDRVPFQDWVDNVEDYREKGYACLQARVGLEYGEDKKLISNGVPEYVMAELLSEGLTNGDFIKVEGEIRYSKFKDRNDKIKEQVQYAIKEVHRAKEEDYFDEEGNLKEELNYFEQSFVFLEAEHLKKEGKTIVLGRVIDYRKGWYDKEFEVVYRDADGNEDESLKELAVNLPKEVKWGDVLRVWGNAVNRVIITEEKDEESKKEEKRKNKVLSCLGGKAQPQHAEKFTNRDYIQGLQIQGVLEWDDKVYTEDDFPDNQDLVKEEGTSSKAGGLGGKKKDNPFKQDLSKKSEENPLDGIDENDLPF